MVMCGILSIKAEFWVDKLCYYVNSTAVICKSSTEVSGFFVIPSQVYSPYYGTCSVTGIGAEAFYNRPNLTEVRIPNSITYIRDGAFFGCTGLTSITLPNSITSIGKETFCNCQKLKTMNIPNSVTSIGSGILALCTDLTSLNVAEGNKKYDSRNDCNAIIETGTNKLIAGCQTTVIPSTVTSIGEQAFRGQFCGQRDITSINIPNSVTSIGSRAFEDCTGLTDMKISSFVTSISSSAFAFCLRLKKVSIGNAVKSIGESAFNGCKSLTSITIPSSVTSIGANAFAGCTGLTEIVSDITDPQNTADMFDTDIYTNVTLRVPKGCVDKYLCADGWNKFRNIQEKESLEISNDLMLSEDIEVPNDADFVLPVLMKNKADITAIQADLYLPKGFSIAQDTDGEWMVDVGSRTTLKKHSISCEPQADGSFRIVCGSQKNALFSGNEGEVFNVTIHVDKTVTDGDYTIKLRNIALATPTSDMYTSDYVQGKVTIFSYKLGDVNNDKSIDVADLPALVAFILNANTEGFIFKSADLNEDGKIMVDDYVSLVNMILGGANAKSFKPQSSQKDADGLGISVDAFSIKPGEKKEIAINMNNPGDEFTAVQLDLVLPDGISVAKEDDEWMVDVGSRTTLKKHSISGEPQTDGSFRIVCGSQSNKVFSGESGSIILVTLQADANATEGITEMTLKNIVLARTNSTSEKLDPVNVPVTIGNTDGINGARIIGDSKAYYDLQGRKVEHPSKGIYIHGGKKVLIK